MIELNIAGRETIRVEHLVCDVNGTLAVDGKLIDGVRRSLLGLKDRLEIHLITADTHGGQALINQQLGLEAVSLQPGNEAEQKGLFIQKLGPEHAAAIGQGENDAIMLGNAVIGIAVLSPEGLSIKSLMAADLVVPDILSALELFEKPLRMVATLRK